MNMNLKGIMQTLGAKPGQVVSNPYVRAFAPQPTITESDGEDHEVSMANNSIDTIIKMATELKAKMGEDEKQIPAWIQDHIAKAENLISQASGNYHEYGQNESINEGKKAFKVNPAIGSSKYSISSHDGVKKHKDGSDFYDIQIFKNKVDLEKGIKDYKSKGFVEESINEGKTYSNKFAAWFTGTVLNTVKHPTYGKHQLTADQIEKAPGDYKNKLFKAIEVAVKNGDITPDVIRKNESLRLTKLK